MSQQCDVAVGWLAGCRDMDLTTPIIIKLSLRLVGTRFKAIFSSSRQIKRWPVLLSVRHLLGTVQHEYAQVLSAVVYLCYTMYAVNDSCAHFYPSFEPWWYIELTTDIELPN